MGLFNEWPFDDRPLDAGEFGRRERIRHVGRTIQWGDGRIHSFTKRDMYIPAEALNVTASPGAPTTISIVLNGVETRLQLSKDASVKLAKALLPHASFDAIKNELQTARNATVFYTQARPGDILDQHNKAVINKFGPGAAKTRVLQSGEAYNTRRIVEYLDSSAIKRTAYNQNTKELHIEFTGTMGPKTKRIYRYLEVPPAYAKGLEVADSAGRYYNDVIKGAYPGHGVDTFPVR